MELEGTLDDLLGTSRDAGGLHGHRIEQGVCPRKGPIGAGLREAGRSNCLDWEALYPFGLPSRNRIRV
jgi:hypothetical protein